ncbi:CUE domain-containing protein [Aphelenchoides fujianensis]|nr:CUE domain-containing protein [Aphelenchoides fujianensis]
MSIPKAPIRIEQIFAHDTPPIGLPVLRCDASNLAEWKAKLNGIVRLCTCLIDSASNVFWSSVALRPKILEELETAIVRFPFFADVEEGGLFFRLGLESLLSDAYVKLWVVFLRLVVTFEREGVSREIFRELVLEKKILTLRRLSLFCGFFAQNYALVVRKVVGRLRQTVPELFDLAVEGSRSLIQITDGLHQMAAFLNARSSGGERRNFDEVHADVDQLHEWRRSIVAWSEAFRLLPDFRPPHELLAAVPECMEDLNQCFDDHTLANLSIGSEGLMHGLPRAVNHVKQAFTHLFVRFYENYQEEEEKIGLLHGLSESPELLVRLADELREQLGSMLKKSPDQKVNAAIKRAVDQAYTRKLNQVIQRLNERGLLEGLNLVQERTMVEQLDELSALLPYSREFLHLALRHFGYDHEATLQKLLEPAQLSFELRVLIRDSKLLQAAPHEDQAGVLLDDCVPTADSDIESEPEDANADPDRPTDPTLAALLGEPSSSGRPAPFVSEKEKQRKRTEDRLRRLVERAGNALHVDDIQLLVERMHQPKKEEEVVQVDGKKFAKLYKTNPDDEIAQEDREVLRKKLDELHFEDDDLDSDDEYRKMKLEQQFDTEVGRSGRFNRPAAQQLATADMYDDEGDDTYGKLHQSMLNLAEGATVDEAKESERNVKPLGPLGAGPANFKAGSGGRPQSNAAPKHARPKPLSSSDQRVRAPAPQSSKPKPPQRAPQSQPQPQKAPEQPKKEKEEGERKPTAASNRQPNSRGGYTGGKARQNKEQHKGKNKQRGADRKMQRANPF